MREIAGATVLLTGASGGLGAHLARALAAEGATLVLSGRDVAALDALAASLPRATVVPCDLADADAALALVPRAEEAAGPVDVLINNAGITSAAHYEAMDPAAIRQVVAVDLLAAMMLTRAALPGMLARGRGHVVNMSSIAGKGGAGFDVGYGTVKAALVGFTRSLRIELAGTPVGASVICPGLVAGEGIYGRWVAQGLPAPILLRSVAPERVAAGVVTAIRDDRPELMITARPLRPIAVLQELSPRLGERVTLAFGGRGYFRAIADLPRR